MYETLSELATRYEIWEPWRFHVALYRHRIDQASPCTISQFSIYTTMEFEVVCIYRMRKILYDLTSRIETALKNAQNCTSSTSGSEVSVSAKGLVEHLLLFNELVDARMKTNPLEKVERDNYLRNSITNLKEAEAEVETLKLNLKEERSQHGRVVSAITAEINEENLFLEEMKTRHAKEIAHRKQETAAEIARLRETTLVKAKLLEDEINSGETRLKDALKGNLSRERELYAKRSKSEMLYLAVLANYDRDVGALHRTMENLTDQLRGLDDQLEELEAQLAIQDVQYVELKNERELAILKAFAEDLEHFEKNRAARIIQKAWRSFYERCCMRKKKKSKKKK